MPAFPHSNLLCQSVLGFSLWASAELLSVMYITEHIYIGILLVSDAGEKRYAPGPFDSTHKIRR